ncbi:hypothetical protein DPV78_008059 [Talaromyces pinophilus]|nr:hypothetical protein DPV78_008059 [Talaromyces pinophilus]
MDVEVRFQTGGRLDQFVEGLVESGLEMKAMGGVIVRFWAVGCEMIWFQITPASVGFGTDNDDMAREEDIEMPDAD